MENTRKNRVRKLTASAILGAISVVLLFLEVQIPIFPSFLKLDLSDLPAIIASFTYGPVWGIAIVFVKNVIHIPMGTSGGIGELANFVMGSALIIPAGLLYLKNKTLKRAIIGMASGIVLMTITASAMNYFVLIPFYTKFMPIETIIQMVSAIVPAVDSLADVILFSVVPFNLLKGIVVCVITLLVYKRISGLLHGRSASSRVLSEQK